MFTDKDGKPKRLIACSVAIGSARIAELAARMGFDAVWIELEHASCDLATAEAMCVATVAGGAIPLVRTAGYHRDHILHALEIGGQIIVIPQVNDADAAREVVKHGKFRPLGERGFNTRSRGMEFGLEGPAMLPRADVQTHLLPQIETLEAVKNVDAILDVKGLSGIFIGPGDLSAVLGTPMKFDNPNLQEMSVQCISKARARGLHAGILCSEGPLLDAAITAGADLLVASADYKALIDAWRPQLERLRKQ